MFVNKPLILNGGLWHLFCSKVFRRILKSFMIILMFATAALAV